MSVGSAIVSAPSTDIKNLGISPFRSAALEDVETVIYDIQDAGARPYTYISSLKHLLTATGKSGAQVIVCDRPAPLSGSIFCIRS